MMQMLLAVGADVNATDNNGLSALHSAAQLGMLIMVQQLLAAGANAETVAPDRFGRLAFTPLLTAASLGHTEVVRELLAAGASVEPERNADMAPLHAAALEGHLGVVQLLLRNGADPRVEYKGTAVISGAAGAGHVAIVQLLLEEWGQPPPPAVLLVQAANAAVVMRKMAAFARLVKELRKLYPAELQKLVEGYPYGEDQFPAAAAVAAVLKEWASDVSKRDERQAAVRERQETVAKQKQELQQLVVHVAGIAADLVEDCLPDVAQFSC
jgi:hypothetical protein